MDTELHTDVLKILDALQRIAHAAESLAKSSDPEFKAVAQEPNLRDREALRWAKEERAGPPKPGQ
jgi:hypothetical protein